MDGVRLEPRPRELLDEVVLLVRQAGRREHADRPAGRARRSRSSARRRRSRARAPRSSGAARRPRRGRAARVSRSGWWTKLNAKRPLTQRLPSFGRYSGFEVTFTMRFVCGSTLRSIWQPTPQNVHVVCTCSSARSGSDVPLLGTSRRSRRSGRRRGSRRRARTRCRASAAPRSGRCARRRAAPFERERRALHHLLRVADAAVAEDARVRVVAHQPVAVVVRLALRVGEDERRLGAELAREVGELVRPAARVLRSGARTSSISVSVSAQLAASVAFVETTMPSRDARRAGRQRPRRALDVDDAHAAAAVGVELVVVAERRDERRRAARRRGRAARPRRRDDRPAVERELDHEAMLQRLPAAPVATRRGSRPDPRRRFRARPSPVCPMRPRLREGRA